MCNGQLYDINILLEGKTDLNKLFGWKNPAKVGNNQTELTALSKIEVSGLPQAIPYTRCERATRAI